MLPHWFVYVGWAVCFLAIIASGFFTILYSFQWGKEKSEKWLTSVLLSFAQDSALIQPLKIVVIAIIFATLCRRSVNLVKNWKEQNDEEVLLSPSPVPPTNTEESTENQSGVDGNKSQQSKSFDEIEASSSWCKLRRRRILEKNAVSFITEFFIYIVYIVILFYVAYIGHQDRDYFQKTSQLQHIFDTEAFESISTFEDYWNYVGDNLLPSINSNFKYNGDKKHWRDRVYIDDNVNYRAGPIRLRQLRVTQTECDSQKVQLNYFWQPCVPDYVIYEQDTRSYSKGWTPYNQSAEDLQSDFWIFEESSQTKSMPTIGRTNTLYDGGGYVVDLGNSLNFSQTIVQYLKENLWLDRFTRAVFIEFTVYNANVNLFSTTLLLAEFLPTSGFVATAYFLPFRLYIISNSINLFVASAIAALMVVYYISQTISRLIKKKRNFFKKIWNYFGILRILLFLAYVFVFLYSMILQTDTVEAFQGNTYEYTNFLTLASISSGLRQLVGAILFFETVQILEFFKYQKQLRKFSMFFLRGRKLIAEFFGLFSLNLLAFIFIAMAMFSALSPDFQTFIKSFLSLVGNLLGHPTYSGLKQIAPVFGQLFYVIFSVQITYLMLNFLIGVIDVMLHTAAIEFTSKVDGKDLYFQIVWGLFLNWARRMLHMKEKEMKCFEEDSDSEEIDDKAEIEIICDPKPTGGRRNTRVIVKRRKKRRRNATVIKVLPANRKQSVQRSNVLSSDEFELLALRRLKELEKAVEKIDFATIESVSKTRNPALSKCKFAGIALKELDNILEDIERLMKID